MDLTMEPSVLVDVRPLITAGPSLPELQQLVSASATTTASHYAGPIWPLRLSEGSLLIELPERWRPLRRDADDFHKTLLGAAGQSHFHAFAAAPMTGPLPALLALSYCLHGTVEMAAHYLERCEVKFGGVPDGGADVGGDGSGVFSAGVRAKKKPKVPALKFLEFVSTLRRSTVDVLVLSPDGALLVTRGTKKHPEVERTLVALYTDDEGETYWPLEYLSRRQPSIPGGGEGSSPFAPVHSGELAVESDFPEDRKTQQVQQSHRNAIGERPSRRPSALIEGDLLQSNRTIETESVPSERDVEPAHLVNGVDARFVLPPRPRLFPDEDSEEPAKADDDGAPPQPFEKLMYPNLNMVDVGFGPITAGGLKFKRNMANFAITLVAGICSLALSIAVLLRMLDNFSPCCHDALIDSASPRKFSNVVGDICHWNATLTTAKGRATEAMIERCQIDVCTPAGLIQEEALYAHFWNDFYSHGRFLVLVVIGSFLNILLALLLNYFVARPLAIGGTPRFWAVIWVTKILMWGAAIFFAAIVTRDMQQDFFIIGCNSLTTSGTQLCHSMYAECDIRLVATFREHSLLRALLYALLGANALGLLGAFIFPLPSDEERNALKRAEPDLAIFRRGAYAPDGIDAEGIVKLQNELRAQFAKSKHNPHAQARHAEGMGEFLVTSRSSPAHTPRKAQGLRIKDGRSPRVDSGDEDGSPSGHGVPVGALANGGRSGTGAYHVHLARSGDLNHSEMAIHDRKPLEREVLEVVASIERRIQKQGGPSATVVTILPEQNGGKPAAPTPLHAPAFALSSSDLLPMSAELAKIDEIVHTDNRREALLNDIVSKVVMRTRQQHVSASNVNASSTGTSARI